MKERRAARAAEKPDRTTRRIKVWHGLLALTVLVVAGILMLQWHWKRAFRRRIEALAAMGYPVTPEQLDAWYVWPETGENGADWVLAAAAYFSEPFRKEHSRLQRKLIYPDDRSALREAVSQEDRTFLVQHVRANTKALESLHRATPAAQSRYPVDLSQGLEGTVLPFLSDVRESCLLLCFEAILCGEEGDSEGAIQAIEAAFAVARTLRTEPLLMSQMVNLVMVRFATTTTERLLCRGELAETHLARLAQTVGQAHEPGAVARGVAGNRCVLLELFMRPESIDPEQFRQLPPSAILAVYADLGLAAREGVLFIDLMGDCLTAAESPAHERYRACEAIETRFRRLAQRGVLLRNNLSPCHTLKLELQVLAYLRCGQTALAAERYRLGRGCLPGTLAELVPDFLDRVPEDPYDGAPLRYRRLDRGFMIYSVGEDGVDEGGKEKSSREDGKSDETCDITFVVTPSGLP